jgi:hypothetical protein
MYTIIHSFLWTYLGLNIRFVVLFCENHFFAAGLWVYSYNDGGGGFMLFRKY